MGLLENILNSPYLGVGGIRGLARLSKLTGHGLNLLDKMTANGAYMGIGKQQLNRAVQGTLFGKTHGLLAGQMKRMQLDKALRVMPDSETGKIVEGLRAVMKGALPEGRGTAPMRNTIIKLLNLSAASNPTQDPRIARRITAAQRKHTAELYNTLAFGSYGGFVPDWQDPVTHAIVEGNFSKRNLVPWKAGNVVPYDRTKLFTFYRDLANPRNDVYAGIHDLGGGMINIEDPIYRVGTESGLRFARGMTGSLPMGTMASTNITYGSLLPMVRMLQKPRTVKDATGKVVGRTRPRKRKLYLPGAAYGNWGNLVGEKTRVPKSVAVNEAGLWNWPEIADSHLLNFGEKTFISNGDHSEGMEALARHRDIMEKRFKVMQAIGLEDSFRNVDQLPADRDAWKHVGRMGTRTTDPISPALIESRFLNNMEMQQEQMDNLLVDRLARLYSKRLSASSTPELEALEAALAAKTQDGSATKKELQKLRRQIRTTRKTLGRAWAEENAPLFDFGVDPLEADFTYSFDRARQ